MKRFRNTLTVLLIFMGLSLLWGCAGKPENPKNPVGMPAEAVVEGSTGAVREPLTEPTVETESGKTATGATEPEPITELPTEVATEPEPITEPLTEPEPTVESETEPATEQEVTTEPTIEPPTEPATEPPANPSIPSGSWRITQYGSDAENQRGCYAIEDSRNRLILIDGGYDYNADALRQLIAAHGNHVNAWIITHPHPDHAGAINVILENPAGITIGAIYTVQVTGERYRDTAADYDQIEVYEKFHALTENLANVIYIKENDEWDSLGLHFKALHAWNSEVDDLDDHLCNNGSLMFVMSGGSEKMLFCSDVQREMQEFIIRRHLEELDVDYVQLGHHGNWGLTWIFYEYTSPRAVFFDAPSWLVNTAGGGYDAYMLKSYFAQKGVTTYEFGSAPNSILLH